MTGALINAFGIILGATLALLMKKPLSPYHQRSLKIGLGAFTVFFGLKLTWTSLHGSFGQVIKQFGVVLLAMILGKIIGKLLCLQKGSNRLGQFASRKIARASANSGALNSSPCGADLRSAGSRSLWLRGRPPTLEQPSSASANKFNEGFLVCATLYCAAPLAMLASVQEGLNDFSPLFVIKAFMDGAAAMAFASMYGPGVLLSALPVLAFQSALTRVAHIAGLALQNQPCPMADAVLATNGLLIFCVALVILQLKRIEIADYLPSLVCAPMLIWLVW